MASGACRVWVFVVPGRVCGQVVFAGSHLMDAACDEFVEAHEGVRGKAMRVGVIVSGREVFRPSVQQLLPGSSPEGRVCLCHQGGGAYVRAGLGGHFDSKREAGEAFSIGDSKTS